MTVSKIDPLEVVVQQMREEKLSPEQGNDVRTARLQLGLSQYWKGILEACAQKDVSGLLPVDSSATDNDE